MAIAVSGTSPARASAAGAAATTSPFDPPICLLVAAVCGDGNVGAGITATITTNGTPLAWTEIGTRNNNDAAGRPGHASAWYAVLSASRTGMTVTATLAGTGAAAASLQVYCVSGADTAAPIGAQAEGSSTANQLSTPDITTVGASSLGVVVGVDWQQLGTPGSAGATVSAFNTPGGVSGLSAYRTLAGAGSAATFDLDAAGVAAASWNWLVFELRATPTPLQSIAPAGVAGVSALGAAAVTPGPAVILAVSANSAETFGVLAVSLANVPQQAAPPGIAAIDDGAYFDAYSDPYGSFGVPTITVIGGSGLGPAGVPSSEQFGALTVALAVPPGTVAPPGIPPAGVFGVALVTRGSSTAWTLTTDVALDFHASPNPFLPFRPSNRLRYRIGIGASLLRIGGIWRAITSPSLELQATADRAYAGGRIHTITAEEAAQLIAQGFGDHVRQGE